MKEHIFFQFKDEFTWTNGLDKAAVAQWLAEVARKQQATIEELVYVFCSDDFLLDLNKEHLNHDFYTDILTFPYSYEPISAEIYISVDRVKENAKNYGITFKEEWLRVMAHGLLHMMKYLDKTDKESIEMRSQEDQAISLFDQISSNE